MQKNQNKRGEFVFKTSISHFKIRSYIFKVSNLMKVLKEQGSFRIPAVSEKYCSGLFMKKKDQWFFGLKNLMVFPPQKKDKKYKKLCMYQSLDNRQSRSPYSSKKKSFPFFNRSFDKKRLKMLFSWYYANRGEVHTFSLVETLQKLGFAYAMKAGISLGVDDLKVPRTKGESLIEAVDLLDRIKASVNSGNVTALEEFQQFIDTWHRTSENLKTSVVQNLSGKFFLKKSNDLDDKEEKNLAFVSKTNRVRNPLKSAFGENVLSSKNKNFSFKRQQKLTEKGWRFSSLKEVESVKVKGANSLRPLESKKSSYGTEDIKREKPLSSTITMLNPVYMMAFSGARGNLSQVRQLVGMRGLMADPQGQLVEFPIQSNFREGLTVTEYMISCYGARKGLVDTALRTAAAGYLTRRLVDVSHHQIVRSVTCSTKRGILYSGAEHGQPFQKEQGKNQLLPSAWKVSSKKNNLGLYDNSNVDQKENSNIKQNQQNKDKGKDEKKGPLVFMVGRVLARDIPGVAFRNQEIDISLASSPLLRKVYDTIGIYTRSPLTCKLEMGICQLCYGWSVSANRLVGLGEAVGIIAAQSIGEPGTQLTMRTFHTGGVYSGDIMEECRAKHHGIVCFQNIYLGLLVRTAGGSIAFCLKTSAIFQIKGANEVTTYTLSANTLLFVRQGEKVIKDSLLAQVPNLPTLEENTGEAYKTLVSNLSGEVRQHVCINPELATIRILAAQEYREFYFSKDKNFTFRNKKQIISTNAINNRETEIDENQKLFSGFEQEKKKLLENNKTKITCARVNLIWGAHRLGDNDTFNITINRSNAKVILPEKTFSLDQSAMGLSNSLNKNVKKNFNFNETEKLIKVNTNTLLKRSLLGNLRFFVDSKLHQNQFQTFSLFKTSDDIFNTERIILSGPGTSNSNRKAKNAKVSNVLVFALHKNNKNLNSGLFQWFYKGKFFFKNKSSSSIKKEQMVESKEIPSTLSVYHKLQDNKKKLKEFFLAGKQTQVKKEKEQLEKTRQQKNFIEHKKSWSNNSFYSSAHFFKNNKNKKSTNSFIEQISILKAWPLAIPPTIKSFYLYWKLVDLLFFKSSIVKNRSSRSFRIAINEQWWGSTISSNSLGSKNPILNRIKGSQLIFSKKENNIKDFPDLVKKLFAGFNKEKRGLIKPRIEKAWPPFARQFPIYSSFENFSIKGSKPIIKAFDSGEIFPLQRNKKILKDLKKNFYSFREVNKLNSGLLTHYNRVSYKIPLCYISSINDSPYVYEKNPSKEGFFLSKELAKLSLRCSSNKKFSNNEQSIKVKILKTPLVTLIGEFINIGDEIITGRASAYCGQIIETSPFGLTLRLTQNILYSNLRNRPAKINKKVKNGLWIGKGSPLVTLPYISNVSGDIVAGIPKIEQLFEARGENLDEAVQKIWSSYKVSIVPRSRAVRECFKEIGLFVVAAIQKVYSSQGVHIADKHLEVIIRQMTRRVFIVDPGDTEFLPEEFVELNTIECVNWATYGEKAIYRPHLIGITKASLTSNSFLSSASFQQTARVLERETVLEKTDRLLGLKERVMMGALINAGTGELKTSVRLADRSLAELSSKLFQKASFFSRRKIHEIRFTEPIDQELSKY